MQVFPTAMSLYIDIKGKQSTFGLYGIDRVSPEDCEEAKAIIEELTAGKEVVLIVKHTTPSGRLFGDVALPDGKELTHELVSRGLAKFHESSPPENCESEFKILAHEKERKLAEGESTSPEEDGATASQVAPATQTPDFEASESLGISRRMVRDLFSNGGFEWKERPPIDGEQQMIGRSNASDTAIQLIGPPDDVCEVAILICIPEDDQVAGMRSGDYMRRLTDLAAPSAASWVASHMKRAAEGNEYETTLENRVVKLYGNSLPGGNLLGLTVVLSGTKGSKRGGKFERSSISDFDIERELRSELEGTPEWLLRLTEENTEWMSTSEDWMSPSTKEKVRKIKAKGEGYSLEVRMNAMHRVLVDQGYSDREAWKTVEAMVKEDML